MLKKFLCFDFIPSFLPKIWCPGATIQLSLRTGKNPKVSLPRVALPIVIFKRAVQQRRIGFPKACVVPNKSSEILTLSISYRYRLQTPSQHGLSCFPGSHERGGIFCFVFSEEGFNISEETFSTVHISTVHFTE